MAHSGRTLLRPALALLLATAPCPSDSLGNLVVVAEPQVTYDGAGLACGFQGGQMVMIGSEADNSAVKAAKDTAGLAHLGVWLGGALGEFRLQKPYPVDLSYDGSPHCLFMLANGGWEDQECSLTYGYVCEMPSPPPSPLPPFAPGQNPRPPPRSPPPAPPSAPPLPPPPWSLSDSDVAGIVIGLVVVLIIVAYGVWSRRASLMRKQVQPS